MQTNSEMCEVLYGLALDYAALQPADVAWDLYCGAGAIGLLAAPHVRRVVGVEISSESIGRARDNAERNGIANAEFMLGDVAKELRTLLERAERPSVVFVDPPRAGLTPRAVRRLIELAPRADRLRLVQPDHAGAECAAARGRRIRAGARAARRHVPAHAPHRVREPGSRAADPRGRLPVAVEQRGQLGDAVGDARRRAARSRRWRRRRRAAPAARTARPPARRGRASKPHGATTISSGRSAATASQRGRVAGHAGPAEHVDVRRPGRPSPAPSARLRRAGRATRRRTPAAAAAGAPTSIAATIVRRMLATTSAPRSQVPAAARVQPVGQQPHAGLDLADRVRVERDHLGIDGPQRDTSPLDTAQTRHRSWVMIRSGCQLGQHLLVDRVERAALQQRRAHGGVDVGAGSCCGVDAGRRHDRQLATPRRPVALGGAADQQVVQAQVGDDLGRAGQQRDDAHGRTLVERGGG